MTSLNALKPRFILDAYKIGSSGLTPLNASELNKFCTQDQANELLGMLPTEATNGKLVDTLSTDFVGGAVSTNYRDDSDATNLKCLSISFDVKVFQGYDANTGDPKYTESANMQNCGEILSVRGSSTKLVVNGGGSLVWG